MEGVVGGLESTRETAAETSGSSHHEDTSVINAETHGSFDLLCYEDPEIVTGDEDTSAKQLPSPPPVDSERSKHVSPIQVNTPISSQRLLRKEKTVSPVSSVENELIQMDRENGK